MSIDILPHRSAAKCASIAERPYRRYGILWAGRTAQHRRSAFPFRPCLAETFVRSVSFPGSRKIGETRGAPSAHSLRQPQFSGWERNATGQSFSASQGKEREGRPPVLRLAVAGVYHESGSLLRKLRTVSPGGERRRAVWTVGESVGGEAVSPGGERRGVVCW